MSKKSNKALTVKDEVTEFLLYSMPNSELNHEATLSILETITKRWK